MRFETLSEACHAWVESFNAVPQSVIEKLIEYEGWESVTEITPLHKYSRVYVNFGEYSGEYGEIIETNYNGEDDLYLVQLDSDRNDPKVISGNDLGDTKEDGYLPMWSTMWQFSDSIDNDWLSGEFGTNGLQVMADLGFRIYEQEDYGYIFGIDGCGYSFYTQHWYPLYKARGLHWHDVDDTEKESA